VRWHQGELLYEGGDNYSRRHRSYYTTGWVPSSYVLRPLLI
jgi:hypothetical protein